MFDLKDSTLQKGGPVDRIQIEPQEPDGEPSGHELDSEAKTLLHAQLLDFYRQELSRQGENRALQAEDEAYYDNKQWTPEEIKELTERGQAPLVYNVIATSIDWVTGSEKRGRTDFKILPRGKEDSQAAECKTKYMKYLSDANKTPFHRSRAFEDAVKVGIGWMECGVQDEDDGEPIYERYESWRNMIFDSASTELDGSDMRYQFRVKIVDEDVANAMFPDRKDIIAKALTDSALYISYGTDDGDDAMDAAELARQDSGVGSGIVEYTRNRVRLIEAWYRVPEEVKVLRGGAFNGQIFDEKDGRHTADVQGMVARVITKVKMRVRVAIMTTAGLLYEGESPYRHNRLKFIPIWGFRDGETGLPYGLIRRMKDIQSDINKRASKAQFILSTNKVVMDEGALPDGVTLDDFAEEVAKPDAILVKRKGYDMSLNVDRELAPAHLDLMSRGIQMIQQAGGVTDELLGRSTNAVSGVAVQARQEQGSVATNKFFDNLRFAEQMRGETLLSLIEQYATEKKQFRVTNMRGTPEYITVNDGLPENDITRTKADFVISEAEWRATMRQAAVDQLLETIGKIAPVNPQLASVVLDLVVENMDIPNREEIVKRIRQMTGMRDPDQHEPSPEEAQAMQAQQAMMEKMQALQDALAEANIRLVNANADARAAQADRTRHQGVSDKIGTMKTAMEAAEAVITMPTIARVGDGLLREAGFKVPGLPPPPRGIPPHLMQGVPSVPDRKPPEGDMPPPDQQQQPMPGNPEIINQQ